jgi:DNA-binding transcriptional LysR family regulator
LNLDTKWLEDFTALAELQSFTRAAQARHITQPAFGRHIRSLEKAVGQTLVDRSKTPIALTPAGRQFRVIARNIMGQIDDGLNQLHHAQGTQLNPIRIASPHSLSSPILLDLIECDKNDHQHSFSVDILRVDIATLSIIEGDCDFFLGFEILSLMQPPFKNLNIGHGNFLLVSATDDDGQPRFDLSHQRTPITRYSSESYSARLIEQYQPRLETFNTYTIFESSMCHLHKEVALRGKGLAWLPDALIQEELNNKSLIAIAPERYHLPYQIRLYRNAAPLKTEAELFWKTLSQRVNSGWKINSPWNAKFSPF